MSASKEQNPGGRFETALVISLARRGLKSGVNRHPYLHFAEHRLLRASPAIERLRRDESFDLQERALSSSLTAGYARNLAAPNLFGRLWWTDQRCHPTEFLAEKALLPQLSNIARHHREAARLQSFRKLHLCEARSKFAKQSKCRSAAFAGRVADAVFRLIAGGKSGWSLLPRKAHWLNGSGQR